MPERRVAYQVLSQGQLSGLSVKAPSIQRLFIDAALALNDFRVSLDLVKDTTKLELSVKGDTLPNLMLAWLNEVAGLFETKHFLAYRIVFTQFDGKKLSATLTGETYESARHGYARPFNKIQSTPFQMGEADGGFGVAFYVGET